jgi:hypothetical protein
VATLDDVPARAGAASGVTVLWSLGHVDVSHVLVVVALAGWLLQRALDLAAAEVNRSAAKIGQLRVLAAQAEEAEHAAVARTRDMGDEVLATLRSIATGVPLSEGERRTCLALEAATRDGLVAAPLPTAELGHRLASARASGIRVDLTVSRAGPGLDGFGRLLAVVLERAEPGSEVRVFWYRWRMSHRSTWPSAPAWGRGWGSSSFATRIQRSSRCGRLVRRPSVLRFLPTRSEVASRCPRWAGRRRLAGSVRRTS